MSVLRDERDRYRQALVNVLQWLGSMPSGVKTDADPNDTSPEDMCAYVSGRIWQECQKALRDE